MIKLSDTEIVKYWGIVDRGLTGVLTTLLQGNQKPLLVRDEVVRSPDEMSLRQASPWNVILPPLRPKIQIIAALLNKLAHSTLFFLEI